VDVDARAANAMGDRIKRDVGADEEPPVHVRACSATLEEEKTATAQLLGIDRRRQRLIKAELESAKASGRVTSWVQKDCVQARAAPLFCCGRNDQGRMRGWVRYDGDPRPRFGEQLHERSR
jgi:hypothetical protein